MSTGRARLVTRPTAGRREVVPRRRCPHSGRHDGRGLLGGGGRRAWAGQYRRRAGGRAHEAGPRRTGEGRATGPSRARQVLPAAPRVDGRRHPVGAPTGPARGAGASRRPGGRRTGSREPSQRPRAPRPAGLRGGPPPGSPDARRRHPVSAPVRAHRARARPRGVDARGPHRRGDRRGPDRTRERPDGRPHRRRRRATPRPARLRTAHRGRPPGRRASQHRCSVNTAVCRLPAESPGETRLRWALRLMGYDAVPQFRIVDGSSSRSSTS